MQLYAYDTEKQLVHAKDAVKQCDYFCLECQQIIRLRSGPHRTHHFYHRSPTPLCRQHQKGVIHLQLQNYLLQQLTAADCRLEMRFNDINRIADVAWLSQKIIFEIQYSYISANEVLQRNSDYAKIGWKVIWIFHDKRYNQKRLSAAEMALRQSPHYFSNMNAVGNGILYDQFDICENGIRKCKLHPLQLYLHDMPFTKIQTNICSTLITCQQRIDTWKMSLRGDLFHLIINHPSAEYLISAKNLEISLASRPINGKCIIFIKQLWRKIVVHPYKVLFRFILEKSCR